MTHPVYCKCPFIDVVERAFNTPFDLPQDFQAYSFSHFGVVGLFVLLWGLAIVAARRQTGPARLKRAEYGFGVVTLVVWTMAEGYWLLPSKFSLAQSMPINPCDIVALFVPLAFFRQTRILITLMYFWGFAFGLQAVLTPELHHGPGQIEFWLFWSYHALVVGAPVYFIMVHGYRPNWRDWRNAIFWTALYVVVVLPIDIAFGWNYGYIGAPQPTRPTIIDVLGPWPQRIGVISVLVFILFTLLVAPWQMRRRPTAEADAQL